MKVHGLVTELSRLVLGLCSAAMGLFPRTNKDILTPASITSLEERQFLEEVEVTDWHGNTFRYVKEMAHVTYSFCCRWATQCSTRVQLKMTLSNVYCQIFVFFHSNGNDHFKSNDIFLSVLPH